MAGCGALGALDTCRSFAVTFYFSASALVAGGVDAITGLDRERLVARTNGCRTEGSERRNHGCHFFAGQEKDSVGFQDCLSHKRRRKGKTLTMRIVSFLGSGNNQVHMHVLGWGSRIPMLRSPELEDLDVHWNAANLRANRRHTHDSSSAARMLNRTMFSSRAVIPAVGSGIAHTLWISFAALTSVVAGGTRWDSVPTNGTRIAHDERTLMACRTTDRYSTFCYRSGPIAVS